MIKDSEAVKGQIIKHYKGDLYAVECVCKRESDLEPLVVYRSASGALWSRPLREVQEKFALASAREVEEALSPTELNELDTLAETCLTVSEDSEDFLLEASSPLLTIKSVTALLGLRGIDSDKLLIKDVTFPDGSRLLQVKVRH